MQITEVAAQILARAEQRAEIAAQNITNASTPGYRRRVGFAECSRSGGADRAGADSVGAATDFTAGQLVRDRQPTDLAIAGEGFFAVRGDEPIFYTRQGQFRRDAEGRLVTGAGAGLQSADGGDVDRRRGRFRGRRRRHRDPRRRAGGARSRSSTSTSRGAARGRRGRRLLRRRGRAGARSTRRRSGRACSKPPTSTWGMKWWR